jgi:hypothetical protein
MSPGRSEAIRRFVELGLKVKGEIGCHGAPVTCRRITSAR